MTVAVSKAAEDGAEAVICASTGNTAASAAAYAARAGIPAVVLTPEGAVAGAKVAQTRMLGARVLEVRGDFDEALAAAQELARRGTHVLVNSVNPYRREGQKTAVFEIVEELGAAPDAFVIPYGGGGNTSAYAAGIAELGLATPIFSVEARAPPDDPRLGDPDRRPRPRRERARLGCNGRDRLRRGDRRRLARARDGRGPLLRAVVGGGARGDPPRRRPGRAARGHDHRPRAEGHRERRPLRAAARAGRRRPRRDRRRRPRHDDRPRAGDLGQHRRRLRHRRRRVRPLERARGDRRRRRRRRGRGRLRARRRRHQPRRPRVRPARRPGRQAVPLRQPDPARARARLVRGRDRARPRRRGAARRAPRSCWRPGSRSSHTPTTSRPRCSAA